MFGKCKRALIKASVEPNDEVVLSLARLLLWFERDIMACSSSQIKKAFEALEELKSGQLRKRKFTYAYDAKGGFTPSSGTIHPGN